MDAGRPTLLVVPISTGNTYEVMLRGAYSSAMPTGKMSYEPEKRAACSTTTSTTTTTIIAAAVFWICKYEQIMQKQEHNIGPDLNHPV